jgi:outer membrane protein insertion porin family
VGGGIRWFSPMGPLRVEWGYNLNKKSYEQQSAWEFTIGGTF